MVSIRIVPMGTSLSDIAMSLGRTGQDITNQTAKSINLELARVFKDAAVNNVHVITGRTRNSFKISPSTSSREAIVTGQYGAGPEIRRGGPHNYSIRAYEMVNKEFPNIATRHIGEAFRRNAV